MEYIFQKIVSIKIKIRGIKKSFGSREILKGLDLDVFEGETIVILGGSGSGKTVFLKILSTLMEPDEGSIKIDEQEITGLSYAGKEALMQRFGYAFQLNALFDSYTIWENVAFKLINNSKIPRAEIKKIAIQKLEDVGLKPEIADLLPSNISGGMQKRVAIARALVGQPEVLFFDEPTSGLDPLTSRKIAGLIKDCDKNLDKKITKFAIVHDIGIAKTIADRIIFLYNGHIEWIGRVDEMENGKSVNFAEFVGV